MLASIPFDCSNLANVSMRFDFSDFSTCTWVWKTSQSNIYTL